MTHDGPAVLLLEGEWRELHKGSLESDAFPPNFSVSPFFECLGRLERWSYFHRQFSAREDLQEHIERFSRLECRDDRRVVIIAGHGGHNHVDGTLSSVHLAYLKPNVKKLSIEGVVLLACDVGTRANLDAFIREAGCRWAVGFNGQPVMHEAMSVLAQVLPTLLWNRPGKKGKVLKEAALSIQRSFQPIVPADTDDDIAAKDMLVIRARETIGEPGPMSIIDLYPAADPSKQLAATG